MRKAIVRLGFSKERLGLGDEVQYTPMLGLIGTVKN